MTIYYNIKFVNSQEQQNVLHSVILIVDLHIDHVGGSISVLYLLEIEVTWNINRIYKKVLTKNEEKREHVFVNRVT